MELQVTMIPAPDDPDEQNPIYQEELAAFARYLARSGIEYRATPGKLLFTDASAFNFAGTFVIAVKALTPMAKPIIGAIVGYLHGKNGRKVRVKVSPEGIEVEAHTEEEVERLLKRAAESPQRNQQPRVIP